MSKDLYDLNQVDAIIDLALKEDIATGDITSKLVIPAGSRAELFFVSREDHIVCGVDLVRRVFKAVDATVDFEILLQDGKKSFPGGRMIKVSGDSHSLLAAERVALNFMQRMCGIATITAKYVEAVKGTKAKILDTRKTIPGMRALDKYACHVGGAENHRFGLYDMILIKDNHIAIAGSLTKAVAAAAAARPTGMKIEVEIDNYKQFQEALKTEADIILLDNYSVEDLKKSVELNAGRKKLEASGGVNLQTVKEIAETGVDYISVGRITHSVPAIDIGLDYVY